MNGSRSGAQVLPQGLACAPLSFSVMVRHAERELVLTRAEVRAAAARLGNSDPRVRDLSCVYRAAYRH